MTRASPPVIDWKGSENLAGTEIAWPAPVRLPSLGGLETVGYEDGVVLPIAVRPCIRGCRCDYRGRWALVFFGYTNCPDECPQKFATLSLLHSTSAGICT